MRCFLLLPLALLASPLAAAESALPKFDSSAIGVPPLSLAELGRHLDRIKPPALGLAPRPTPSRAAAPTPRPGPTLSRMPIVRPDPAIDYALIVRPPDPAIDHKLIVRAPGIESAR